MDVVQGHFDGNAMDEVKELRGSGPSFEMKLPLGNTRYDGIVPYEERNPV